MHSMQAKKKGKHVKESMKVVWTCGMVSKEYSQGNKSANLIVKETARWQKVWIGII